MASFGTVKEKDIRADGKFRRKYELDEGSEPRTGINAAAGLLLANAILVIKQVFFSSEAESAHSRDPDGPVKEDEFSELRLENTRAIPSLKLVKNKEPTHGQDRSVDAFTGTNVGNQPSRFDHFDQALPNNVFTPTLQQGRFNSSGSSNVVEFPAPQVTLTAQQATRSTASNSSSGASVGRAPGQQRDKPDEERNALNRLPVVKAPVVLNSAYVNQSIIISISALLNGTHDPDGDQLQIVNLSVSSGEVIQLTDANWKFMPDTGDIGDVTFRYGIADAHGSVSQFAHLDLLPIPGADFIGTEFADRIVGTAGRDRIDAQPGDDDIVAREGDDVVTAGQGLDRIVAGSGDDVIFAGPGDDVILAGDGNDIVFGGEGDDFISGGQGDDNLLGEEGNDTILAGVGDDAVFGDAGNDFVDAGPGSDLLDGGAGDDILIGGDNDDVVIGGTGSDVVDGGPGDDVYVATPFDGDDVVDGGAGSDTYNLSSTSADAQIDLAAGKASSAEIGDDTIANFENVTAGQGDDVIVANDAPNKLIGNKGNDLFVFLEGNKSGHGGHIRDRIEDFEVGDKIDVTGLDSNTDEDGWQRVIFKFDQATFDHVGQAIYRYEDNKSNSITLIQFKFDDDFDDDDGDVDFEIEIIGRHELNDSNILT